MRAEVRFLFWRTLLTMGQHSNGAVQHIPSPRKKRGTPSPQCLNPIRFQFLERESQSDGHKPCPKLLHPGRRNFYVRKAHFVIPNLNFILITWNFGGKSRIEKFRLRVRDMSSTNRLIIPVNDTYAPKVFLHWRRYFWGMSIWKRWLVTLFVAIRFTTSLMYKEFSE